MITGKPLSGFAPRIIQCSWPPFHTIYSRALRLLRTILYALVPQLFRTRWFCDELPATKVNETSWMNGARGLSALIVFSLHYLYAFSYDIVLGYGYRPDIPSYIYQIPPLPLLYDGTVSVQVFFTVAGYVCSYRALSYITEKDFQRLFQNFPASVFRRFFRLYLPAISQMLLISILAYIGAYEPTRAYFIDKATYNHYFPGPITEPHPMRFPDFRGQLAEWSKQVLKLTNISSEFVQGPNLDAHLWTIPAEFRGSMHLSIALLALANCRPIVRISFLAFLGYVYGFQWPHNECVPFFYGAIIAQFDILSRNQTEKELIPASEFVEQPQSRYRSSRMFNLFKQIRRPLRFSLYIFSLYIASYPARGMRRPSMLYAWVNRFVPDTYGRANGHVLPKQIGIFTLFYLISSVPLEQRHRSLWHRMYTNSFALYLGRIMFGLYLMHGVILHLIGYAIPYIFWHTLRVEGQPGHTMSRSWHLSGLAFGYIISLALALWAADVWTREVEGRLTRWVKVLERLCFIDDSVVINNSKALLQGGR